MGLEGDVGSCLGEFVELGFGLDVDDGHFGGVCFVCVVDGERRVCLRLWRCWNESFFFLGGVLSREEL